MKLNEQNPTTAIEALDNIFAFAAISRASDIHIDPRENDIFIRLRIDGLIEEAGTMPLRLHEEIIARLKILAGARTDVHMIPQDGRWQAKVEGQNYNFRASFMPTYFGENVVIRLLSAHAAANISFARLGFTPDHVHLINKALAKQNGLILATGPTGSGKTTTLHACLSIKSKEPISIITLEDPVEYEIAGVRQIHINHTYGVTFANGLRSALRQDPDVIMVGEIRDNETAQVSIHTALTGHLVFSTLHTNSALEAILRLIDMGIDRYLLASTLRLIIAQRLIRNMCHECFSAGCYACRNTGYNGRSVIAEICEIDSALSNLIIKSASLPEYLEYACSHGYRRIDEDGMEKMEWGVTTKEEIIRVLSI
jgi:type II secretory ATPase GspE/PulE/Tfp pilus assembly ATPase PilB-like protein